MTYCQRTKLRTGTACGRSFALRTLSGHNRFKLNGKKVLTGGSLLCGLCRMGSVKLAPTV